MVADSVSGPWRDSSYIRAPLASLARYPRVMRNRIYRFGDYRVCPAARELEFRDELVVLSPKVFDCLAYLIEHRERAVGRDELISAVWGKLDVSDTLRSEEHTMNSRH